jgi:hypothetical protein
VWYRWPIGLPGILTGALLALPHPRLASQAPADRVALSALSDSLAWTRDTVALRDRQRAIRDTLRHDPGNSLTRIRLGLVGLRLAELGGAGDARRAVKTLHDVAERRPEWPFAWYALGLAETQRSIQ